MPFHLANCRRKREQRKKLLLLCMKRRNKKKKQKIFMKYSAFSFAPLPFLHRPSTIRLYALMSCVYTSWQMMKSYAAARSFLAALHALARSFFYDFSCHGNNSFKIYTFLSMKFSIIFLRPSFASPHTGLLNVPRGRRVL
jgi:hypothetical protein